MQNQIRPTGVQADRNRKVLTIRWSDGKESELTFAGLRAVCPCVVCKGGHDNMGGPADMDAYRQAANPELNIREVQQTGSYGLQFYWSDGHWEGIYTWAYLREIGENL
ncbi:MAG: DUF971 domain-containing protein [Candidatus Promineifilaceae bacterium]